MERHVLEPPHQITGYPGGKNGMWRVKCSCGYQTSYYATGEAALKPARTHQQAKLSTEGAQC